MRIGLNKTFSNYSLIFVYVGKMKKNDNYYDSCLRQQDSRSVESRPPANRTQRDAFYFRDLELDLDPMTFKYEYDIDISNMYPRISKMNFLCRGNVRAL